MLSLSLSLSFSPSLQGCCIFLFSSRVLLSEQAVHPARETGDNMEDPPKVWLLQHSHSQGQLPPTSVRQSHLLSINTLKYQGTPPNLIIVMSAGFNKCTPILNCSNCFE